jgi:hypothetical protein
VLERKKVARSFAQVEPLLERIPGVFAIGRVSQNAEGAAMALADGEASGQCHAIRERMTTFRLLSANLPQLFSTKRTGVLITFLLSTVFRRGNHMNWFYWNTAWSLFFSLVWFMTIAHNPDAQISDAHLPDEAFGG